MTTANALADTHKDVALAKVTFSQYKDSIKSCKCKGSYVAVNGSYPSCKVLKGKRKQNKKIKTLFLLTPQQPPHDLHRLAQGKYLGIANPDDMILLPRQFYP